MALPLLSQLAHVELTTPMPQESLEFWTQVVGLEETAHDGLERDARQTQHFLAVLAGAVPIGEFFSPSNLRRLLGLRGPAKIAAGRLRPRRGVRGRPPRTEAAGEADASSPSAPRTIPCIGREQARGRAKTVLTRIG